MYQWRPTLYIFYGQSQPGLGAQEIVLSLSVCALEPAKFGKHVPFVFHIDIIQKDFGGLFITSLVAS